ncbi:MAG: vitamin K epoxide reductase family protein [Tepidisphaeraceae bacterium]
MQTNVIFQSPPAAHRLSDYLREGHDSDLARRRGVVALSLASVGTLGVIALYQTGWLRKVPGPPVKGFDGCRVNSSDQAYQLLSTPDALLGLTSYGVTAALAAMGGPDRPRRQPWIPLALAAKAATDALAALKLTIDQAVRYRAFCGLCLVTSLCTFGVLPLVWPEARRAAREIIRRSRP